MMNQQNTPTTGHHVAILGGGIAGLGVARALLKSGFSVTVFERNSELARETSDNSLRIIHGGFRYLQKLAFLRILDSICDQTFCLRSFQNLVRPLTSIMPLAKWGMKSKFPVFLAALAYGFFLRALRSPLPSPKIISKTEAEQIFPWAKGSFNNGALSWTDAQLVSHHSLVKELSEEILSNKGIIRTSCDVRSNLHSNLHSNELSNERGTEHSNKQSNVCTEVSGEGHGEECGELGRSSSTAQLPTGVALQISNTLTNTMTTEEFDYCVEALGHNANAFDQRFECGFVRAFNLIFKTNHPSKHALGFSGDGGRLFFLVPRGDSSGVNEVALGTEYLSYSGSVEITEVEVQEFFEAALRAQPALPFSLSDLVRVEKGVVPTESTGSLALKGRTEIRRSGRVLSLLPSKYTTFKSVGERVARELKRI